MISIITVCLNVAKSIARTIESVLEQTYSDYEYIIIDGGSTDGTLDIIGKYSNSISHVISEPDNGIFNAQNKGIRLAIGDYLLFLNAGDYLCDKYVLEKVFQSSYAEDLLYGDIIFKLRNKIKYRFHSPKKITKTFMLVASLSHPCTFISKNLFEKTGLYDEQYVIASDYDFFMKAIFKYNCSMRHLPIPISVFNLEGISSKKDMTAITNAERRKIQEIFLDKTTLKNFKILKYFNILFYKKLKYLYNFVKSVLKN